MSLNCWPEDETAGMVSPAVFGDAKKIGEPAPDDWYAWVTSLFPTYTASPFAKHHAQLWEWAWAIELESSPDPFVAIWARGGAKSSSAELVTAALGVRGKRQYIWYVRAVQDDADTSVTNIAGLLESASIARHYPAHGEKQVNKFGDYRAWRRDRLQTAGGLTIDALGLDTAVRGIKVDEHRPDLIILDDIDGKHDSLTVSLKKIQTITTSILPAMAKNGAVLAIQNLIHKRGFFARMVDGRADYLSKRIVSGPIPAVRDMKTEMREDPETKVVMPVITKGKATWAGQDLPACQHLLNTIGLSAFEAECQHDVFGNKEGVALRFQDHHLEDLSDEQAKELVKAAIRSQSMSLIAGMDFGHWRFGFNLRVVDTSGRVHQVAEYFNQRSGLRVRAQAIDAICRHYGCPPGFPIWGDAANPTDIQEINLAFDAIQSNYRVLAVGMANKARQASVERMNDLLDRKALLYRRDVTVATANILAAEFRKPASEFMSWRQGLGPASEGALLQGSRLLWEVKEWSYAPSDEGEPQDQDPDDATADGADMIASDRYAIMSWWSTTQAPKDQGRGHEDIDRTRIVDGDAHLATQKDLLQERFEREHQVQSTQRRSVFARARGRTGMKKIDL